MRKQGLTRHKVISSGRLTAGGRCQTPKKRVTVRSRSSAEPAYSLYSTDSEDQVTTIHKGLDRCAALLNGILQTEKTDATASSAGVGKEGGAASRPLSTLGKDRGQTKSRKQTKTGPAPVQKLVLSTQFKPGLKRKGPIRTSVTSSSSQTKFNCHLTTSTPADSPERLASNGTENTTATTRRPTVPPGSSAPLAQQRDPIPGSAPSHHGGVPSTNGPAFHHPVCPADPAVALHAAHPCSSISGGRAAAPPGGCGSSRSPPPRCTKAAESGPGPGPGPALSGSAAGEEQRPRPRPQSHLLRSRARSLSHPRPSGRENHSPSLTHGQSHFVTHADHSPQSHLQIHTHDQPSLQSVGLANSNANLQSAGLANANLQSTGLANANANLQSVGLANAHLQSAGLANTNANLQSAGLANANANLQSAGLANANANLQLAGLANANANLQSAGLANANMQSVELANTNSNLQSAGLANPNANLQSAGLANTNANLQSAGLANPNLQSQTQSDPEIPPPARTGKGSQSAGSQEGVPFPGERHREGAAVAGGDEEENEDEGECDDDVIPVRDTSAAQTGFDRPPIPAAACACSHPHTRLGTAPAHTRSVDVEAAPERAYARPPPHTPHPLLRSNGEGGGPERTRREVRTVQYLLGELKALLAGQGGVAERLVSDLEQTVSLLPVMVGSTNIQAEIALVLQPLRSENAQLRRRVRILNQQLQGRERAEREARPLHCDTEMSAVQVELSDTETQLHDLQLDNARLRQALEDTQSQLEQSGTENRRIKMALEERGRRLSDAQKDQAAWELVAQQRGVELNRLSDSQRDQAAWELVAQQRGVELNRLQQLLRPAQGGRPIVESDSAPSRPVLTKRALDQYQDRYLDQHSALERDQDPVSQYLRSLDQGGGGPPASPPCKGPPQTAQRKDTLPGHSGLGSSTLPGHSGLGSSTLPGQSGLGSSTLPGQGGLGSSTLPGLGGLGSSTLPGQGGLGSSTLPGHSGLGSSTLPVQIGLGSSTLPGQKVCVSADHGLSVCVPVEKSVCASSEQDWSVTEVEQDRGGGACDESQEEGGAWDESQEEGGASSPTTGHQRLSELLKALLLHPSPKRPARLNETSGSSSDPLALPNVPVNPPQRRLKMGNALTPDPALASFLSSSCDLGSLASDWSAGSSSTFDTRDEQEFRVGLAALDASIASLQRTIQQDLRRT